MEYLGTNGTVGSYNLFAYCENDPMNAVDPSGHSALTKQVGSAATFLLALVIIAKACGAIGMSNFWNPVGWVLLAVAVVAVVVWGIRSLSTYFSEASQKQDLALISYATTAATPPPPNKGGKGTQTSSTTLYKKGKTHIDVEVPGNRAGQIHLQINNQKYFYNPADASFHCYSPSGPMAPKAIQNLLKDREIIRAIAKGLRYLGY